jgi:hypothetical protein
MVVPAHLGLAHPNLVWLVVVGLLAFVAGLGVNLYRSTTDSGPQDEPGVSDESLD